MKLIKIDKKSWTEGLEKLRASFALYGPMKEQHFYNFRALKKGEVPDLSGLNSRLSPKGVVFPQSQVMFTYSLDENQADHHILQEAGEEGAARAVIGIRPCDAAAFLAGSISMARVERPRQALARISGEFSPIPAVKTIASTRPSTAQ